MKRTMVCIGIMVVMAMGTASPAPASVYKIFEQYGGTYQDAEKSPATSEDDLMCWAAAAANMLNYSGWGNVFATGDDAEDEIFQYYQNHWTPEGGNIEYGLGWWFDGSYSGPTGPGWSTVDVAGGGFYSSDEFSAAHGRDLTRSTAMTSIDTALRSGSVVGLSIFKSGAYGHAVTCWGIDSDFSRIWITDSDDQKNLNDPPDYLAEVAVLLVGGEYVLSSGYLDGYVIDEVHWLDRNLAAVPLPTSLVFMLTGLLPLGLRLRKSS